MYNKLPNVWEESWEEFFGKLECSEAAPHKGEFIKPSPEQGACSEKTWENLKCSHWADH